jgi:hypothetical protein
MKRVGTPLMKIALSILLFYLFSLPMMGQRFADYGVMGGATSYFGDINQGRPFYSLQPAGGLFFRYNLNPRQALRANLMAGGLKARDTDFDNDFQQARAANFSATMGELALQFEFNFLPYSTQGKRWNYTPYIAAGAGITYLSSTYSHPTIPPPSGSVSGFVPVIPFSFGFKINIRKNIGIEAEYGFRKSFYDNFDGLNDRIDPADVTPVHNNDWYTFAGIGITWKIYNKRVACPAYGDEESKRRP